jgi:hypothetical protein
MAATGDYLLFADSDDMLPEDAVEKLTTKAESTHAPVSVVVDDAYLLCSFRIFFQERL